MSLFSKPRLARPAILAALAVAVFGFWRLFFPPAPSHQPPVPAAPTPPVATPAPTALVPAAPPPTEPRTQPELDAALAFPDPARRSQEFFPKFVALINQNFEAGLAYLRQMPRGNEFSQALLLLLDQLSRRDPEQALAVAVELIRTRDDRNAYGLLFDRFVRENPARALERLVRVPPGASRESAFRALADTWARLDSVAALAWARQVADPAERDLALECVLREIAQRDPTRAISLSQELFSGPGPGAERVLQFALQILANTDPARASQVLMTLPPGDVQTMATMDVARGLAQRDLKAALAWAKSLQIDFAQWLALTSILSVWAQTDQLAAARYVADMPPGPTLDYVAGQFAAVVASRPQDAIRWAEALPSESARDAAFVTIASAWAQRAPAEAIRWAESLEGEPLRSNALAGAHSMWRMLDPQSARAWLETAKLPPQTKARILAPR